MSEQAWVEANSKLRDGLTLALEAEMSADEIQTIVDEEVEAFHSNDAPPSATEGRRLKPKAKIPLHEADRGG